MFQFQYIKLFLEMLSSVQTYLVSSMCILLQLWKHPIQHSNDFIVPYRALKSNNLNKELQF
jgi:hypothetical protein